MSRLSSFQVGRGIPFEEPQRTVPTGDDIGSPYDIPPFRYDLNGNVIDPPIPTTNNGIGGVPTDFSRKNIRVVNFDLDTPFTDILVNQPGTLIFISGQVGTLGPIKVRLDNYQNDPMTMVFDRAISGIPFKQFYLTNPTAQPGVKVEITIVSDAPIDRVGLNG